MRAKQQVSELTPRGPRLRQKLGNRSLQQALGEKKRRLKRNPCRATSHLFAANRSELRVLIEKPHWLALGDARDQGEYPHRRTPVPTFNHAEVGHRGRRLRINLGTARR